MRGFADRPTTLKHASRGLGVDVGNRRRTFFENECASLLIGSRFPPRLVQPNDVGSVTVSHFAEALSEVAAHEYREFRSRRNEVRYGGLHPGTAGAG